MTRTVQFQTLPPFGGDQRQVAEIVRGIMDGKTNNTGEITLATGNATTTTINDSRIGNNSLIFLTPLNVNSGDNSVPFGSFQNTADQTAAAANTVYTIALNTTDIADGMYLSSNKIYFRNAGTYNIQFSFQFSNTDTQIHESYIWLAKNGTNLSGTASKYSVINKHGGSDGYLIGVANFFATVVANDYIELKWAVSNTGIYIEAYTAQTSPFVIPSIPSSVVTATLVSPVESPYISSVSQGSAIITHYANSVSGKTYGYIVVG